MKTLLVDDEEDARRRSRRRRSRREQILPPSTNWPLACAAHNGQSIALRMLHFQNDGKRTDGTVPS